MAFFRVSSGGTPTFTVLQSWVEYLTEYTITSKHKAIIVLAMSYGSSNPPSNVTCTDSTRILLDYAPLGSVGANSGYAVFTDFTSDTVTVKSNIPSNVYQRMTVIAVD